MENWINLSVVETELDFDAGGAITLIPLNYLVAFDQISQERFYVEDTNGNFGEFHYRQTTYASPDALISFIANYFDTPSRYIVDKDPALTDNSDYKAPSQSAIKQYVDNGLNALSAADIAFTPYGSLTATDVQAALQQMDDIMNPSKTWYYYTDFTGNANSAATFSSDSFALAFAGAGAGSVILTASETGRIGILAVGTGTTTTGVVAVGLNSGVMALGDGDTMIEQAIKMPVLSVLAERFTVRVGFLSLAGGDPTNGAYFRYADNVNSGNWQLVTRSGGVETAVNLSTAPVANTWYKLTVIVNAAATLVTFYIDGVSVGTSSTNIGTANIGGGMQIVKSLGTTSRLLYSDFIFVTKKFTTPR